MINEAKLALEAKAITSKAVIAELEKMDKAPSVGNKRPLSIKMSRSPSPSRSTRSTRSTGYLSRVLMNRKKNKNATKKINKNKNKNNNKNNISNEDLLLIQNEFTPSNMATNVTDEKLYSK